MKLTDLERLALGLVVALAGRVKDGQEAAEQAIKILRDENDKLRAEHTSAGKFLTRLFPNASGTGSWTFAEIREEVARLRKVDLELGEEIARQETKRRQRRRGKRGVR